MNALLSLVLCADPALAAEQVYPIADFGVQIAVPKGWVGKRWSDNDLAAETPDKLVQFVLVGSDVQALPAETDAALWARSYERQATLLEATEPKARVTFDTWNDLPIARGEVDFRAGEGGPPGRMLFVSVPVEQRVVHLVTFGKASDPRVRRSHDQWFGSLVVTKKPAPVELGGKAEAEGFATDLPDGWRVALPREAGLQIPRLQALGVEDLDGCFLAVRPRAALPPDLMLACRVGLYVGIVDDYTFADVEADLRPKMFGPAAEKIPAATPLALGEHRGFHYRVPAPDKAIAMVAVPYEKGLARFWTLGNAEDAAVLEQSLLEAARATTFSGPHPATVDQHLAYWFGYRPLSPQVLCPSCGSLCCVGAVGIGLFALTRRRRRSEDVY